MPQNNKKRNFAFWLVSLLITGTSVLLFELWTKNTFLQIFAVLTSLMGGFFQCWFNLKDEPDINDPAQLSVLGILFICSIGTSVYWLLNLFEQKGFGFVVYLWSLGLGNLIAGWYFKRLQLKGK